MFLLQLREFSFLFLHLRFELLELSAFLPLYVLIFMRFLLLTKFLTGSDTALPGAACVAAGRDSGGKRKLANSNT